MKKILILAVAIFTVTALNAQKAKRSLRPDDYALWKALENPQISNNGKWVSYELNPYQGDGDLYVYNAETATQEVIPRGYEAQFASCSEFIVFKIKPQEETVRKEKLAKKKKEQLPKDSLGVIMLGTSKIYKYPAVKSFMMPEKSSDWFAFILEPAEKAKEEEKDSKKSKIKTETFIVAQPKNGRYITFEKVNDYFATKDGNWFGYVSNTGDSLNTASVNIYNTQNGNSFTVFKAQGEARQITVDGVSSQLAFMFSADTSDDKVFKLYYASEKERSARMILDSTSRRTPAGFVVSPHLRPYFSDDNTMLFFGTAPYVKPMPKDTIPDEDKVSLDIWSWTDSKTMSQQLHELDKENKRNYLTVYLPQSKTINQLGTLSMPDVQLVKNNDGRIALGSTSLPYELESSWEQGTKKDYFIVDVATGKRTRFLQKSIFQVSMSPEGKYVAYYAEKDSLWYLYDVEKTTSRTLSVPVPKAFHNTDNDMPGKPAPYGVAGWTENDRTVLIYDKYDIWEFDTDGETPPVNITKGKIPGKIINRYVSLNPKAFCISKTENLLIKYTNEDTYEEGFYYIDRRDRDKFRAIPPAASSFFSIQKAKEASKIIFRKSTYSEVNDLWITDMQFQNASRISNSNPQTAQFNWGSAEITSWTFNKKPQKGLLLKPDNFDPKQKYPMIVYFYEKTSQTLHRYYGVTPSRSVINYPLYTSNGYLIFIPDITFEVGKPGESALNIILSGVTDLISKGFVDQARMGIHGQSWGGYLTAYIITRTPLFKCAMAGAPVANMTSAYPAVRKESGAIRISQYESGQSRIGATLWQRRDLYIENSPLFAVDKITTPLLIMHNDNDGAVPWTQGQELFLSLRRLQKPAWMLNYNNDEHNLAKKQHRIDLSIRMFQFFNHYLKNEPMPEWMKNGIPAKDKGRNSGF